MLSVKVLASAVNVCYVFVQETDSHISCLEDHVYFPFSTRACPLVVTIYNFKGET